MGNPIGPVTREQFDRFGKEWKQGEHVLISGPTGSGKTELASHVVNERVKRGGHVVVFVGKLQADETLLREYKGWTRWTTFRKRVAPSDKRILLWPDVEGIPASKAVPIQREVFAEAFDMLSVIGKWTVQIDEGLYTCSPTFLGLEKPLGMAHAVGRSAHLTMVTLTQRPSHLPLILYGSASHAFVGRTRELADRKRLAELGGEESSKELIDAVSRQGRHDFLWVPVAPGWPAETINLRK